MAFLPICSIAAPPARPPSRTTHRPRKLFTTFPTRRPQTLPARFVPTPKRTSKRAPKRTPEPFPQKENHPITPPEKTRKRKPHGFWNDISNLENELLAVSQQLSLNPRTVPRLADLRSLGRADIIAALSKHGGLKKVAMALRWTLSTSRRKSSSARPRRPNNYWHDLGKLQREIVSFINEFGTTGRMPTRNQFYTYGRSDLVNAAAQHGGLISVSKTLGLTACVSPRKRNHHFEKFETLKEALLLFSQKYTEGRMPTGDELIARNESGLANAVSANGGFPSMAKRCGLAVRSRGGQGAPEVWDERRLKREILAFCMAYYPELATKGGMPTERMLRKYGRCDLSYAVSKFGGFAKVASTLGLRRGLRRLSSKEL